MALDHLQKWCSSGWNLNIKRSETTNVEHSLREWQQDEKEVVVYTQPVFTNENKLFRQKKMPTAAKQSSYCVAVTSPVASCILGLCVEILWTSATNARRAAVWIARFMNHDITGITTTRTQSVRFTSTARLTVGTTRAIAVGVTRMTSLNRADVHGVSFNGTFCFAVCTILNMSTLTTLIITLYKGTSMANYR